MGTATINAGASTIISGAGFAPLSALQVVIGSKPERLSTIKSDSAGRFRARVQIPAQMSAGVHGLYAVGSAPNKKVRAIATRITVLGPVAALANLRVEPHAFAPDPTGTTSTSRLHKTGTTVRYTDTQATRTRFTVLRARPGHTYGTRCVTGAKRPHSKRGRRCIRYAFIGRFLHHDHAGRNRFHFTGRVGGRKLKQGHYRLDATPIPHGAAGRTVSATFRIIRELLDHGRRHRSAGQTMARQFDDVDGRLSAGRMLSRLNHAAPNRC